MTLKRYIICISPKKVKVEYIGSTPSKDVYNSKPYMLYEHIDRSQYIIPYEILEDCDEKAKQMNDPVLMFLDLLYKTDYYKNSLTT